MKLYEGEVFILHFYTFICYPVKMRKRLEHLRINNDIEVISIDLYSCTVKVLKDCFLPLAECP